MLFRYAKYYAQGNSVNTGNHIVEWQAYTSDGTNRMAGRWASVLDANGNAIGSSAIPTDGSTDTASYYSCSPGQAFHVDMGAVYDITNMNILNYFGDYRTYLDMKILVSMDNVNWFTVYDAARSGLDYPENGYWFNIPLQSNRITNLLVNGLDLAEINAVIGRSGAASLGDARVRQLTGVSSGPISMSQCQAITNCIPYKERVKYAGGTTPAASRSVSKTTYSPTSVSSTFSGTINTLGPYRQVNTQGWTDCTGEYLKYDNTGTYYAAGAIIDIADAPPYMYQERVTRSVSQNSPYNTIWDVYVVKQQIYYEWHQDYQGVLYITYTG